MKIRRLLIPLILSLGLTACHHKDPLERYNRSMYEFNTMARPILINPLVVTYAHLVPVTLSELLLNSHIFVKNTLSTPFYLVKRQSPLSLWNRWLIELLLGGFGSTAITSSFIAPLPQPQDNSWPIVLPLIGPIGMVPLAGAILGNQILVIIIPSSGLRVWSLLGTLAKESKTIDMQTYLANQNDPYATHLRLMRLPNQKITQTTTYALPDF